MINILLQNFGYHFEVKVYYKFEKHHFTTEIFPRDMCRVSAGKSREIKRHGRVEVTRKSTSSKMSITTTHAKLNLPESSKFVLRIYINR